MLVSYATYQKTVAIVRKAVDVGVHFPGLRKLVVEVSEDLPGWHACGRILRDTSAMSTARGALSCSGSAAIARDRSVRSHGVIATATIVVTTGWHDALEQVKANQTGTDELRASLCAAWCTSIGRVATGIISNDGHCGIGGSAGS
jgi:hypothetical protein